MAEVVLENVYKRFGNVTAVADFNLHIQDKEFMVFVGPSGCGKTTTLRMIAGLEEITEGTIRIGDRVVNDVPPKDRDIAMVFQNYALYPHMNVYQNMSFGLRLRRTPKAEIDQRVREAAQMLQIEHLLDRRPRELSGGQRQRVALGRAIVRHPKVFLMDEPLSNLDAKLRVQMRTEISKLHNRIGTTTIYVTHDQTEAMTMADRIVVIKDGVVQQIADPQRMYEYPENIFVAGFIGSPAMNFIRAHVERDDGDYAVVFGRTRIPVSRELAARGKQVYGRDVGEYLNKEVILGIRPEHMEDASLAEDLGAGSEQSVLEVTPQVLESMGSEKYVYFEIPKEQAAHLETLEEMTEGAGSQEEGAGEVSNETPGDMMVARISAESEAREGGKIRLAIDASKIHLFDPESEEAVL